jgi:hypothetical protein
MPGVPISSNGNNAQQIIMLDKNVKHIINAFNQVYLLPQDLLFGFNTISKPKLQYPLSATTMPLSLLLAINLSFPREIVHASIYFYGIILYNIESEQVSCQVTSIITPFCVKLYLSIQFIQLLETFMILSGIIGSPLVVTNIISYDSAPGQRVVTPFYELPTKLSTFLRYQHYLSYG